MIEKKDWENARTQYAALYINALVNIDAYKHMLDICEQKLKDFPEEKDDMPEDLKNVIGEIKNA